MTSLEQFHKDTATRDNVKAYLQDYLAKEAVKKVFAHENVEGVAVAKEVIDGAFEHLSELFDPPAQPRGSASPR